MKYETLFLDFYGTLVHEDDAIITKITEKIRNSSSQNPKTNEISAFWWQTFRALFENSFGATFKTQRELETLSIKAVLEKFHCKTEVAAIDAELFEYWQKPEIFPETKNFLNQIQLPICIVSNIDRADIESAINHHNLKFDIVITSQDAKSYKPREEIFRLALEKTKIPQSKILHIGDSISSDIIGANNLGIDTFWLNRKQKPISQDIAPTYSGNSLLSIQNHL